jgi:cation diffusion facilitator family transporter
MSAGTPGNGFVEPTKIVHELLFHTPMSSNRPARACFNRTVQDGSKKAIIAAFFANLGIAVAKFVGFILTGSAGMLAEAIHSVADTGNQGLLMLGAKRAKKEATPKHPFGYGRERYFWAFAVALVLFTLGGAFAIYEGVSKLRHPHEPERFGVGLVILLVAVALESYSFKTAWHEAKEAKGSASLARYIKSAKSPELPVVLLEDAGALLGLLFALIGLLAAKVTGNARWDALGSLAIGLLLSAIAVFLCIEMKSLLIGESATDEELDKIVQVLTRSPEVNKIIHMRTQHFGPEELLVGVKIEFDRSFDVPTLAKAIDTVEERLRTAVPIARVIYIEPDLVRSDYVDHDHDHEHDQADTAETPT